MNKNEELEDGKEYWLGATWALYCKETDSFRGGNWFVHRSKTCFADKKE